MTDNLRKDMYVMIDGSIYVVSERKYKTQGRQGGLIILYFKNVETGQIINKTVKAGTKFDEITPEYHEMQYLYKDGSSMYFMHTSDFSTIPVSLRLVEDYVNYLKEGDKYLVMFYEDKALSLRKNPTVKLQVVESVDAVKGNTANAATKMVTTETGYRLAVPLFVRRGDLINVNTETGLYTGRA